MEDLDIKVLVVGNGGCGKSSLIHRFCKETYTPHYKKTLATAFQEKQVSLSSEADESSSKTIRFMVWDTAGQTEFNQLTREYYKEAQACILVFAADDRGSFQAVKQWYQGVKQVCPEVPCVLVQNKMDLLAQDPNSCQITAQEAESLAKSLGVKLYRVSVKDNFNVKEGIGPFTFLLIKVFHYLAELHEKRYAEQVLLEATSNTKRKESQDKTIPNEANANQDDVMQRMSVPTLQTTAPPRANLLSSPNTQNAGGPMTRRTSSKKKDSCTIS